MSALPSISTSLDSSRSARSAHAAPLLHTGDLDGTLVYEMFELR